MNDSDYINIPVPKLRELLWLAISGSIGMVKYGADLGMPAEEVGFTAEDNEKALELASILMLYVEDHCTAVADN